MYQQRQQNMAEQQQQMFNSPTKAPPQYPSGDMNPGAPQQMDPTMMMPNTPSMQTPSRLTHFSQPDNPNPTMGPGGIGLSGHTGGMNNSMQQLRMRSPMNPMNRYPAPSMSRPMSGIQGSGSEAMNSASSNQFGNSGFG